MYGHKLEITNSLSNAPQPGVMTRLDQINADKVNQYSTSDFPALWYDTVFGPKQGLSSIIFGLSIIPRIPYAWDYSSFEKRCELKYNLEQNLVMNNVFCKSSELLSNCENNTA